MKFQAALNLIMKPNLGQNFVHWIGPQAFETVDYKSPAGYKENKEKDTKAADVEAITYEPKLSTFEMDIMEAQGIKEDRIPHKTYWY